MKLITIFQALLSILLIISILLQQRGASASSVFGGDSFYFQRRGSEKILFQSTIFLSVLFFALAILSLLK